MTFTLNTNFSKISAVLVLAACSWAAVSAIAAPPTVSINGYVTDAKCGAMHGKEGPDVACVKKCIEGGAKPVFVDDKTGSVWAIEDPEAVKGHYGHHITATGLANTEGKSIHIDKVTML
ncbi:hypothetical protein SAMN05421771_2935 [Granulicella pectinivorans]|jgi:hypothetical protein|uniref:Uncharacterized protein n=1 Tax=Granulicella pectinivorans TaxID=474950 RepID=A0A1I6MLP8_9BACT|nr:hypothetical protein [Granulicella pectinivorans]SFS16571.1 hypothetical protein SAMN05421771_2935 [Granulicella pectinivorans]